MWKIKKKNGLLSHISFSQQKLFFWSKKYRTTLLNMCVWDTLYTRMWVFLWRLSQSWFYLVFPLNAKFFKSFINFFALCTLIWTLNFLSCVEDLVVTVSAYSPKRWRLKKSSQVFNTKKCRSVLMLGSCFFLVEMSLTFHYKQFVLTAFFVKSCFFPLFYDWLFHSKPSLDSWFTLGKLLKM